MTIVEITTPLELPPPRTPRTPGLHISNVIRSIALQVGFLDRKWCEDLSLVDAREITDPKSILRIRIGLAWEEHLLPSMEVVDHPGEISLEGIYMTHDGESVDRVYLGSHSFELIVHEVKSTYKSSRNFNLKDQWMWLTQVKAYCKGLRTRFARIHILFLAGNYKYPIEPDFRSFEVEFTQGEIDESWQLLVDYAQKRLGVEGLIPPVLNTVEDGTV